MKIGILTHQYINNYGAFLQAWALRKAISELFPEDEVQIMRLHRTMTICCENLHRAEHLLSLQRMC